MVAFNYDWSIKRNIIQQHQARGIGLVSMKLQRASAMFSLQSVVDRGLNMM